MWRKTRSGPEYFLGRECYGVDPNRNWEYMWGGLGTSSNPCSDTYRGKTPFSEPETEIVAAFLKSHSNTIVAYLSFHSYGQWFLYPWGYDIVELEDWKDLDTLANDAASKLRVVYGTRYTVGNSAGLLYPAAGGSDDYAKSEGIKYAYTVELRDEGRYGFVLPANQIEPSGIETYEAIKVFGTCIAANNCPENVE
ncbi:PREDICTED: carboxypeptidase B-like [Priapulus caudatus]|uniref:Carboxypeptidase B-like n=1 Tax=Priapulus caudatus TaxID=37621 RepID=A0ABM1EFW6_PRICU|nr:PREDICTED: carboxypeptidase B-like [Priapulus caudatus]